MKIGVLGCGGIAMAHIEAIKRFAKASLVHVVDANQERAEETARKFSVPRWSADPQTALDDPAVEWVIVCLPTFLHARWIQACAAAGKHVLTEKPLARTVEQAAATVDTCRAAGVRLFANYQRRYSPAWQRAREWIHGGAIGRPVTWNLFTVGVRSDYYRGPNNWMWDFEKGGGMILDMSIHHFDLIQWISGKPVELFARSSRICEDVTAPTEASAHVRFASGDRLNYAVAWQSRDYGAAVSPIAAVGPKGIVTMTDDWTCAWNAEGGQERFRVDPNTLAPAGLGGNWPFYQQLLAVAHGDTARQPALVKGEEALTSLWMAATIAAAGPDMRRFAFSVQHP